MRQFLRDYGLSVALALIFLVTWVVHSISGWYMFAGDQIQHGSQPELWGADGYFWTWMENTFQNWQSEFLQMFAMVVLTTFLIHRHSHESRDEEDQMKAQIEQILAILEEKK
jgi:hypothetical protein